MFDDTRGGGGDDGDGFWWRPFFGRCLHYILDGQAVRPASNLLEWAHWFENAERILGRHRFRGLIVSTVFLGLDHAVDGPPLLFETAVFLTHGEEWEMRDLRRTSTWAEAMAMHRDVVRLARLARNGRARARLDAAMRAELREWFGPRKRPENEPTPPD